MVVLRGRRVVYIALSTQKFMMLPPTQGWQHNRSKELGLEDVHRLVDADLNNIVFFLNKV